MDKKQQVAFEDIKSYLYRPLVLLPTKTQDAFKVVYFRKKNINR